MAWQEVCGHEFPKLYVQKLLMTGRLGHAFLFSGPVGSGKTTFAHELACLVNCIDPGVDGSCGQCFSCLLIKAGTHPDVKWISPEGGYLRIDEIRSFIHWLTFQRVMSPYRVGILTGVESITEEAANCLLKSLEEPPVQSLLIVVTARPENLLPTILSRCRQIGFSSPSPEEIRRFLVDVKGASSVMAETLAREAYGQVSEALKIQETIQFMNQAVEEGRRAISELEHQDDRTNYRSLDGRLREITEVLDRGKLFGRERGRLELVIRDLPTALEHISGLPGPGKRKKNPVMDSFQHLSELMDRETPFKYQAFDLWRRLTGPEHVLTLGEWLRGTREKGRSVQDWIQHQLFPLLTCLEQYLRDVLVCQLLDQDRHQVLFFPDLEDDLLRDAGVYDRPVLCQVIEQIESFAEGLSGNPQLDIQSIHFVLSVRELVSRRDNTQKTITQRDIER